MPTLLVTHWSASDRIDKEIPIDMNRGSRFSLVALMALVLIFATALTALAFYEAAQNADLEIPLLGIDMQNFDGFDRDMGTAQVTQTLTSRYGGSWEVFSWNPQANTPHYVYGTSFKMATAVDGEAHLDELARTVLIENQDLLGADVDNLVLSATPHALGKWVAHYQQTYQGLEVWQGKALVAFSDDARLMLMSSDYYSDIRVSTTPGISADGAREIAIMQLPFDRTTDSVDRDPELMILPVPVTETEVEHHLVWRLRVRTADPLGAWMTHVDAHTGEIVWRYNDIHFAFGGDTNSGTQVYSYCDGVSNIPAQYLRINVSGVGTAYSDENGDWSITSGGSGPYAVSADLYGPYVDLNNQGGGEATFNGTVYDGVPLTVSYDDLNAQNDERDVFSGVNQVHDYFQLFAPGFGYANQRITANVRVSGTCNAFWDGTINFFGEGGGCANTGEIQGVVHHEFGHGIQDDILGYQGGEGLGEGNGDIISNLITQDPIIGIGFYLNNCTSGIRNSDNNLVYPGDVVGQEIHYAGQVIAGFNWDAMILLQDLYGGGSAWDSPGTVKSGELWHFGRVLLHPTTQPDQVFATFFADDDNGNMDDGTPHHDILCEAAGNHNFDCPEILVGVFCYHAGYPFTPNQSAPYEITADVVSLGAGVVDPTKEEIYYRVDGGAFTMEPMSAAGGDSYTGLVPAQPWGSIVEYYIKGENDLGQTGFSPAGAPGELHYFRVEDSFIEELEFDTAWTAGVNGDNASTGAWERVDPIGTTYDGSPLAPEDDHTAAPGTDCFVTQNGSVGGSAGDADVDGGKTTLLSPFFDLTGGTDIVISYWRWYSNALGSDPNNDWWDVDLSNDGGENWVSIEHTMTTNASWQQVSFNLADYFETAGIVQLRFIAADEGDGSLVEAGVDDLTVIGSFDMTAVGDEIPMSFRFNLSQNAPNPFNPVTEISFTIDQAGPASLKVYDASGRLVKTLVDGQVKQGEHTVSWNGIDDSGNSMSSGVYFYRLHNGSATSTKQMVLIK
jgi:Zn-dependent metalloprotease